MQTPSALLTIPTGCVLCSVVDSRVWQELFILTAFIFIYLFNSEELMDLADEQGFLVIDEVPAVGLE